MPSSWLLLTKRSPEIHVVVLLSGIQVVANGALNDGRVLWNDGEAAPQVRQANRRGIQVVNIDVTSGGLDDSKSEIGSIPT